MEVKFFKVSSLPGTLDANAWYLVLNGSYAETYVTNSSGVAKMVGNSTMINDLITSAITGLAQAQIVNDIAARDALIPSLTQNIIVYVLNATADSTVSSGGATYLWRDSTSEFIKIAEFESMDAVVTWSSITGKPSSSPSAIDTAVTNSHTHTNMSVLNLLSAPGGILQYNGDDIKNWNLINW